MGEFVEKHKGDLVKWLNLILIILIYFFGVVKNSEKTRMEVVHLQSQIDNVGVRVNRLDDNKVDKEIFNLLYQSINRIEDKIDRMQESKIK